MCKLTNPPTLVLHGEKESIVLKPRCFFDKNGKPDVDLTVGEVTGIPLVMLYEFKDFLNRAYEWRRECLRAQYRGRDEE